MEKIESNVGIRKTGINGYFIEVSDQFTTNKLAITKEELEKIVLCGQEILKKK